MEELVVLVDKHNNELGTMPKATVHTANTPLHRAFSLFLFNDQGEVLLQQRSSKKTFPLVWSNSCCGHPAPGESFEDAMRRRAKLELGFDVQNLQVIIPEYIYWTEMQGIVEHEFCPVGVGRVSTEPVRNPDEVEAFRWISWKEWVAEVKARPEAYSLWCVEETLLLEASKEFQDWWMKS